jgi:xanthine dehydrogenase small subunit
VITFYLNGKTVTEEQLKPDLTVLRYLRTQKSLPGTKEGCGSGDCGACTVLIGDMISGQWRYKAVNACISFMIQMQGKSLITVEALANGDSLHPAQQAMVDKHGSQCGFCTPGIVMSLTALHENSAPDASFTLHEIYDALSGNLCRCTGYKPIIDAAKAMKSYPGSVKAEIWSPRGANEAVTAGSSDSIGTKNLEGQTWSPATEEELKALLASHSDARIVAGATDLALEVTQMNRHIEKLISIGQIASLKQTHETAEHITIGAAATYSEVEQLLSAHFPEFAQLLQRLGSRQVRNHGTIGGNIANASPIGDTPPILIALSAEIELASKNGQRWVALDSFYLDYKKTILSAGEYVRAIRIPRLKSTQSLKVYKISKRIEDDISAVLMAINISVKDQKIASVRTGFGGMAAIPKAGAKIETALLGKPLTVETFRAAGKQVDQDFSPFSDVRASSRYRIQVTQGLLEKCALELLNPCTNTRIESILTSELDAKDVIAEHLQGADHA